MTPWYLELRLLKSPFYFETLPCIVPVWIVRLKFVIVVKPDLELYGVHVLLGVHVFLGVQVLVGVVNSDRFVFFDDVLSSVVKHIDRICSSEFCVAVG